MECKHSFYNLGMKNNFRFYRNKRNFTQEQMAKMLNVTRQSYINYENGDTEPSFDILLNISSILKTPIDDLLNNEIYPSDRNSELTKLIKELETLLSKYKN